MIQDKGAKHVSGSHNGPDSPSDFFAALIEL